MDRKSWTSITLAVLGLMAWEWYYFKTYPPQTRPSLQSPTVVVNPTQVQQTSPSLPEPYSADSASVPQQEEEIHSPVASYYFTSNTGGISQIALLQHPIDEGKIVTLNQNGELPIGAIGFSPGIPIAGFKMATDVDAQTVTFTRTAENGIEITKRFLIPNPKEKGDEYKTQLEISFYNPTTASISWPSYWVGMGRANKIHSTELSTYTQFDWSSNSKVAAIDVHWFEGSKIPLLGIELRAPASIYRQIVPALSWASVSNQYFCTILNPLNSLGNAVWASHKLGIVGGLEFPGFNLGPGETLHQSFLIYAGPKELSRLQALKGGQESLLKYGPFKVVSEGLLWGMNKLHSWFGNYAWAIIALTLIIKLCLWPLQNKATHTMKRMALLTPKMSELREKYRDNPQKMNEEMMKLYREYGVNPFGGCLPMLIQIPIFFGFYSMLGTSIELRNSSFLWIRDLSQPDTITHIMNFPINLLPILMAGTMIWQMAISPKSGDAVQQRIFYFMPVIFLVFCYNYASGLALYWTTQNLFSIVQLYLTRNQPLPKLEKKSAVERRDRENLKRKPFRP